MILNSLFQAQIPAWLRIRHAQAALDLIDYTQMYIIFYEER